MGAIGFLCGLGKEHLSASTTVEFLQYVTEQIYSEWNAREVPGFTNKTCDYCSNMNRHRLVPKGQTDRMLDITSVFSGMGP